MYIQYSTYTMRESPSCHAFWLELLRLYDVRKVTWKSLCSYPNEFYLIHYVLALPELCRMVDDCSEILLNLGTNLAENDNCFRSTTQWQYELTYGRLHGLEMRRQTI